MVRAIIALLIMATTTLAVGGCSTGIPYAAAPYYQFPSNGDNEGNGSRPLNSGNVPLHETAWHDLLRREDASKTGVGLTGGRHSA